MTQAQQAVTRAKGLADLYERKRITANTLVSEIASLVTPENINDVTRALTPSARALIREWARSLPDDDARRIVFWPLPSEVRRSFKAWLREQEQADVDDKNGR